MGGAGAFAVCGMWERERRKDVCGPGVLGSGLDGRLEFFVSVTNNVILGEYHWGQSWVFLGKPRKSLGLQVMPASTLFVMASTLKFGSLILAKVRC